jgi:sugar/nucleoside kinase (ribokinase family)
VTGFDLLVAGRPSVDVMFSGLEHWPQLGRDVDAAGLGVCAGTSFNTPAAANRLGLRVGYIAIVGNDMWSRIVLDEIAAEGLPTDFLRVEDRPLPFISVALNRGGERGFVTYYGPDEGDDAELDRVAVETVGTATARHLHTYVGEDPRTLIRVAREREMTVSLDAWGGPWWEGSAPLESALDGADVLFANEAEALAMSGETTIPAAAARLAEHGPCVVVKRGPRGALAVAGGQAHEVPGEPAEIVDTTGAGDCFNAGFLRGWLAGLPVEHCLILGNVCGARAVETFGGYRGCPREHELRAIAADRGITLP